MVLVRLNSLSGCCSCAFVWVWRLRCRCITSSSHFFNHHANRHLHVSFSYRPIPAGTASTSWTLPPGSRSRTLVALSFHLFLMPFSITPPPSLQVQRLQAGPCHQAADPQRPRSAALGEAAAQHVRQDGRQIRELQGEFIGGCNSWAWRQQGCNREGGWSGRGTGCNSGSWLQQGCNREGGSNRAATAKPGSNRAATGRAGCNRGCNRETRLQLAATRRAGLSYTVWLLCTFYPLY